MVDEGKQPSKKFLICINAAIEKRMQEETNLFEEKMKRLKALQERYQVNGRGVSYGEADTIQY